MPFPYSHIYICNTGKLWNYTRNQNLSSPRGGCRKGILTCFHLFKLACVCLCMIECACSCVSVCVWVCVLLRIGIVWLCMNLDLERRDIRPSKQFKFSICPFCPFNSVNKGTIHN